MPGLKLNHVSKRGHWAVPSNYLNQCWNIVNWNLRNKLQWNFNRNSKITNQKSQLCYGFIRIMFPLPLLTFSMTSFDSQCGLSLRTRPLASASESSGFKWQSSMRNCSLDASISSASCALRHNTCSQPWEKSMQLTLLCMSAWDTAKI